MSCRGCGELLTSGNIERGKEYCGDCWPEEDEEDWRERCKTCQISDTCFLQHCARYCSGVIDVNPLLSMIMEEKR